MVSWGIIGCGNVTEMKSGPAFKKVEHSRLNAVMRRDAARARDYATRHQVPKWYDDAYALINDPEVNAVYVATPPSSHEEYALAAVRAGKCVYVEKPFAMDASAAMRIAEQAKRMNSKLCVAHYRREMPLFRKVKELLDDASIGKVLNINIRLLQHAQEPSPENWRLDPGVSGGGFFHDLAPHQLDLLLHYFKAPVLINGVSLNQAGKYAAPDTVACTMLFENSAVMTGLWSFAADQSDETDVFEITGTEGSIRFSVFGMKEIVIKRKGVEEVIPFEPLEHVQQPMIAKVVDYFAGNGSNPCSGDDGYTVMWMIDQVTLK